MSRIFSFEKSVGAVIFRYSEKDEVVFLMLQYRNRHWAFPKGHVEKGETEEETCRREVFEEAGIRELEIKKGFFNKERYWYVAKGNEKEERQSKNIGFVVIKKVVYYLAQTSETEVVLSDEHLDYGWLNYDRAMKKLYFKNSKDILTRAEKFIAKNKK
jgi:8-oxo-dGTP pyrophosphatase MutT (NUDIX family)